MDPAPLDPSLWTQFGPFAVVFVVMTTLGGGIIIWLLRDRASLRKAITEGEQRERLLYDRIIAYGEKFGPILERNTRALDRAEARP